ncbi:YchJ family protein [Pleionea sp. CnH1-48]|uniref:YchJ family protein n=1 Tax=Pleionea sp. CnH1-48 TaxID=2954494 RepID=UPI0020982E08|nr:YchJ family protein [Pleionea sp. CnH1-48]MCO7223108.1 YchJ family protein [Pleionea sp. CnH1-48]
MNTLCPCGSEAQFKDCCEPFILKTAIPQTTEQLMRSRYSAFVTVEPEYLLETHHPEHHNGLTVQSLEESARNTQWIKLKVVDSEGGEQEQQGYVEFKAWLLEAGKKFVHHEKSYFEKIDGRWHYTRGDFLGGSTNSAIKVKAGRNDPCPCGSGKKYKKCCG